MIDQEVYEGYCWTSTHDDYEATTEYTTHISYTAHGWTWDVEALNYVTGDRWSNPGPAQVYATEAEAVDASLDYIASID